jgi:hypothetical protein
MFECTQIICKVKNIADAVSDYTALGFSVEWGADPKKAHNAFLWFEEGPVIELFQVPRFLKYFSIPLGIIFGSQIKKRILYWYNSPEGLCNITMGTTNNEFRLNLKNILPVVNRAGIKTSRIMKGTRTRPDGQKVKFSFAVPSPVELPLLASWYDPPQRPANISHHNGAKAVKWIRMEVSKENRSHFEFLTKKDKRISIKTANETRVLEVGLWGLKKSLNKQLLRGAVLKSTEKN